MTRRLAAALFVLLLAACGDEEEPSRFAPEPPPPPKPEPSRAHRVMFDHILIAFKDAKRKPQVEVFRSKEEAKELAYSLLDRLRAGVSFAPLKRQYSDDRNRIADVALGPYVMLDGVPARRRNDNIVETPRENWARAIADLAFGLKKGEYGVADYDPRDCPYGWHVITVLERE